MLRGLQAFDIENRSNPNTSPRSTNRFCKQAQLKGYNTRLTVRKFDSHADLTDSPTHTHHTKHIHDPVGVGWLHVF